MAAKSKTGMIKIRCPNPDCRKVLAVKAVLGGKKGRCPICGQAMTIPAAAPAGADGKADLRADVQVIEGGAPPAPGGPRGETVRLRRADAEKPEAGAAADERPVEKAAEEPTGKPADESKGVRVGTPKDGPHPTPRTLRRIATEATAAAYELSGNTLRVTGAIGYDLNPVFRAKCDELLRVSDDEIVVDLGPVLYISSSHLGVLAELMTGAELAGKKVTVRASPKASRVIRLAGLDRMCTLEEV